MGLNLPSELSTFLSMIGYNWPQADEEKLFEIGQRWMGFSDTLKKTSDDGHKAAEAVWSQNSGANIDAFKQHWSGDDGPTKVLEGSSTASTLVGAGMVVCAGIVLALKISTITQLVTLAIEIAQAIASAVATFGASLAEIPIFQQITRELVGQLIQQVITRLLDA